MIPPLRKSLKSCRAHKSAALDLERGAHAPQPVEPFPGGSGIQKASFRSKRHGDFYDSFVRGERGFTVGFGESSRGLLETSRAVESKRRKSVKPRGSDIVWGRNVATAWVCLSGPDGNCANCSRINMFSIIPIYKYQHLHVSCISALADYIFEMCWKLGRKKIYYKNI